MSRVLIVYLGVYFLAVIWALIALWTGGIFQRISPMLVVAAVAVSFGLGILLALVSIRPPRFVRND